MCSHKKPLMALRQAPPSDLNIYDPVRTKTKTVISHSEVVFFHWSAAMEGRRTQDAKKATVRRLRSSFGPVIGSAGVDPLPRTLVPISGLLLPPSDPIKRSKASPASKNRTIRPEPNRRCLSSGFPGLFAPRSVSSGRANFPFGLSSRSKACFACYPRVVSQLSSSISSESWSGCGSLSLSLYRRKNDTWID
jgi:hypothetical protein